MRTTFLSVTIATMLLAAGLSAQTATKAPAAKAPSEPKPRALVAPMMPAWRTNPTNWMARHEGFVELAKKGGVDLLFLGDSITDGWRTRGSNVWNKTYAPRKAANFGIGGDRTEHLLWRLQAGELDGIKPKVAVIMIGTNNSKSDKPEQVAEAIRLIIYEVQTHCPRTKVLLLAVFPRNKPTDTQEQIDNNRKVNEIIAKYDDGKRVRFLDINKVFVGADGKVPAEIMTDFLHPNEHGYQLWADAMEPTLAAMLK